MSQRCEANVDQGYWWGATMIDPSEPGFVAGKGIWIPQAMRCGYVAEPGGTLCYKHKFIALQQVDDQPALSVTKPTV